MDKYRLTFTRCNTADPAELIIREFAYNTSQKVILSMTPQTELACDIGIDSLPEIKSNIGGYEVKFSYFHKQTIHIGKKKWEKIREKLKSKGWIHRNYVPEKIPVPF
jgi:hypothetical protein